MLKQKIQEDITNAMKGGDSLVAGTLRMLLASLILKEKEKRYKILKEKTDLKEKDLKKESELTDEETIEVILSEIKKRKEAIALYERGKRQELADKERNEITILQEYLPEQIPANELKKMVEESVNKVGAKNLKDIGKVMQDLIPKVKGKADTTEISKIVKELLSQENI